MEKNLNSSWRPLLFKLSLLKGDSKFLQTITGTPTGRGYLRCYFCMVPNYEWFEPSQLKLEQKPIRWIDNYFSTLNPATPKSLVVAKRPCFIPEYCDPEQAEYIFESAGMWGIEPVFDCLHLIENHSKSLLEFIIAVPKLEITELKTNLQKVTRLPLKTGYTGRNWRFLWASYPLHLKPVYSKIEGMLACSLDY